MKTTITKIIASFFLLLLLSNTYGQSPQAFNYQAVARDASGNVLPNQNLGIKISIWATTLHGILVYSETHTTTTNAFGLFTIAIGNGTPESVNFNTITWSTGTYWLEVEMDPDGGTAYINMGASQLLSVPYALYAETSGTLASYSANSTATTEIASTTITSNTLTTVVQLSGVPAGTYGVYFSCPLRNTSTSSAGLNCAWAITTDDGTPSFPAAAVATNFIPASGWTANYPFGQSGYKEVTLAATGTIELKITYWGTVSAGNVRLAGTQYIRAIKL